MEDKFIHEKVTLKHILEVSDKVFTLIFFMEMIFKWFAYGWSKYFNDGWCWIDFIIVAVRCEKKLNFNAFIWNNSITGGNHWYDRFSFGLLRNSSV
jgi:hypothetical protein